MKNSDHNKAITEVASQNMMVTTTESKKRVSEQCPECFGEIVFEEGCRKCYSCGYSKC